MPNLKFILLQAILSKYGFLTTLLIVIQQLLSASSVYFLTKAINSISNPSEVISNIIIFFILIISPYIPVCIAQVTMYKVVNGTHSMIINKNIEPLRFQTNLLNNHIKEKYISNLSRNSFMIINDYFTYIYRVFSLILNVFFTIIIMATLISIEYLYSFIFSLILSFLFFNYIKNKIEVSSIMVENNLSSYASTIERSWSNFILGSKKNLILYKQHLKLNSDEYYTSKLNNAFLQQVSNLSSAIIALLPLAIVSIYLVNKNIDNHFILSAILVNLTRMVGLFSFLGTLIYDITNFINIKSRIQNMVESLDITKIISPARNSSMKPIYANGMIIEKYHDVLDLITTNSTGRFTITGQNGSGKTTLLYYLLEELKERAIFVPTSPRELDWITKLENLSTGQQIYNILSTEIIAESTKVILLDEWDANLDYKNKIEIDCLIDQLSQHQVIIEVIHKKS